MIRLRISVFNEIWQQEAPRLPAQTTSHHAIWVQSGSIEADGKTLRANEGIYLDNDKLARCVVENARIVRFTLEPDTGVALDTSGGEPLLPCPLSIEQDSAILRLDRVTFPAGATAYRHTHAGAGIRYLTRGRLEVIADDHSKTMETGQAWFEDAYSPVKAIAAPEGVTEFIRVMVLPNEFTRKPTIKLLNPEDEAKPKLQTNYRYFDQALNFSA